MNEKSWGMRFNSHESYHRPKKNQKPDGCPDWLTSQQFPIWHKPGLIIWSHLDKKIVALNGGKTLRCLAQLQKNDDWKVNGVSITEDGIKFTMPAPTRRRRKKGAIEPPSESPISEEIQYEILHLPAEAGTEIMDFLKANRLIISDMAKRERERFENALIDLYEHVLEFSKAKEEKNLDFGARSFQWQSNPPFRWVCRYESVKGCVGRKKGEDFWTACVVRDGFSEESDVFDTLLAAVEWVEATILDLARQTELSTKPRQNGTYQQRLSNLAGRLMNGQHWLRPADLEPKELTYRIYIEVETEAIDFKSHETICGTTIRYDERFPSPSKLSSTIGLDFGKFDIIQPLGEDSGLNQITSLTTFYQESLAAEQANSTWEQSRILLEFKEGKIRHARYGYEEVEAGYHVYLGLCKNEDDRWGLPETRDQYMQNCALRQSILLSLNVADYREYYGELFEDLSDENLLYRMHHSRVKSKFLPADAKRESTIWLAQHAPVDE